jgi:3-oxoacyl-[acyl-carrier-protein] synthase I
VEEKTHAHEMKKVWAIMDNIYSPMGSNSLENYEALSLGKSGLREMRLPQSETSPIFAGYIHDVTESAYTRFEIICLRAMAPVVDSLLLPEDRTLFVLSTTKGNISKLREDHPRISLHAVARHLAHQARLKHVMVISNACISGVMAVTVAKRFIENGKYDHALIVGADELTPFVISGFQSLQALSSERCRPFDANRKGINLGEGGAALLLSAMPERFGIEPDIEVLGSGLTNDANHISGPSRTGEELALAISNALAESNVSVEEIDFVSAHGTATTFNDEMEAKAFGIAGLSNTPVNSLKPFYGHTLGAAGLIELAASVHSLRNNTLLPTLGYESLGVSKPLNVITKPEKRSLKTFLKTASGFGGCNAAIVMQKH